MSESKHGVVVPLRPRPDGRLEARIVIEQAKSAASARLGTTPEVAFEMLRGLARSQGRTLAEYAAEVVANGGRLDG
jgi:AmiR/NasT family two-component response regulator